MPNNPDWTATPNRRELLIHAGRGAGAVAGAGTLASLIAACGSSSPSPSTSSSAAGSGLTLDKVMHATGNVKVLGFSGYQVPKSTPPGMTAKWGYNTTNEQIITMTTQPGSFDLVIITSAIIDQLRLLKRIVPIDVSLLPNWTKIDPFFRSTPFIRREGKIWAVPQHWGYNYTQYNADKLSAPTTYQDLLSPKLRRKIGLPDDPYAVITTFAFFAGLSKDANTLTPSEFKTVTNMLDNFRSQVLTIHQYGEENQLFARHDIYVDLPSYSNSFLLTRQAGINAQYTLLGSWSYIDCYMLLAAATNVPGAYRYINQAIGLPAQLASTKTSLANPVVDSAVTSLPSAMQYKNTDALLAKLPVQPGVTVKTNGPYVPFQMWEQWWEQYKSA
jgi:putative spermidine/putrescine transport system substrate-binding protein